MITRTRLALLGLVAAIVAVPQTGWAETYPSHPVKFIVPYPPGGGSDLMARLIGDKLQQSLGQPFVVENRSGAVGKVGLEYAVRSAPDGYTLVINPNSISMMPILYGAAFDPVKDFAPVVMVSQAPIVLGGHPSVPVKTLSDFISYVKASPGKQSYASCGTGGLQNIAMEALKKRADIDIVHIPYNGCGAPIPDMLSGRVPFYASVMNSVSPLIKTGELRAYAISNAKRSALMPDMPTVAESGFPGFSVENWIGIFAPAGTPPEIVHKLNTEINRVLDMPEIREKMEAQFIEPVGGPPERLGDAVKGDVPEFARVLREVGLVKDK